MSTVKVTVVPFNVLYGSGSGWCVVAGGVVEKSRFGTPVIWRTLKAAEKAAERARRRQEGR